MSQETQPPFTRPVSTKIYADCLGIDPETVRRKIRLKLIPVYPIAGHYRIPADYANRVLNWKLQLEENRV